MTEALNGWKEKLKDVVKEERDRILRKPRSLDDITPAEWDALNAQTAADSALFDESVQGGTKNDQDKLRLDLLPAEGEEGLGEAFTYGVGKYGDHNWRDGLKYSRLIGAIHRHLRLFKQGEDRDKESGLFHVDSIAATAMMLSTYLREGRPGLDDRYKK